MGKQLSGSLNNSRNRHQASNSNNNGTGILSHLRTTASLVLLTLLLGVSSFSVYLQIQRINDCTSSGRVDLREEEMNKPPEMRSSSQSNPRRTTANQTVPAVPPQVIRPVSSISHLDEKKLLALRGRIQPPPPPPPPVVFATPPEALKLANKTSILIWNNLGFDRKEPCDVDCEYTTRESLRRTADASVYERRGYVAPQPGDRFSIYMQMEGEHYYAIRLDDYHLENSYNWRSPLLKPYFEWVHYHGKMNISNPPVSWNDTINGASFIARNCASRNEREEVIRTLRRLGIRVDGLSSCLHTVDVSDDRGDKLKLMRPYKFNLAFENGNVIDYVTEKVYQALAAGVLPVYMGAPNIREYVPDGSIIDFADFDFNETRLAWHLKECMRNESLYNSYHAWRFRPLPEWFVRRFAFTRATTECRTCRYMHAHLNGWQWDKENQRGIPPSSSS